MKRSKRRWAWKAKHKRPKFRQMWWSQPFDTAWEQRYWTSHREREKYCITLLLADGEADVVFPYHHHHSVAWDRW